MENVESGMINAGSLKSWRALERYAEDRFPDYSEWLHPWMEPQWFAWLIAILQQETDTVELFPYGKWATIQHMQDLLAMAAKKECEDTQRKHCRKHEQSSDSTII